MWFPMGRELSGEEATVKGKFALAIILRFYFTIRVYACNSCAVKFKIIPKIGMRVVVLVWAAVRTNNKHISPGSGGWKF